MPSQVDDERFLHRGWEWLEENASHDPRPENYDALEEEWLRRLHLYEEAYRLVNEPVVRSRRKTTQLQRPHGEVVSQSSF